jgi:hypothetical protein
MVLAGVVFITHAHPLAPGDAFASPLARPQRSRQFTRCSALTIHVSDTNRVLFQVLRIFGSPSLSARTVVATDGASVIGATHFVLSSMFDALPASFHAPPALARHFYVQKNAQKHLIQAALPCTPVCCPAVPPGGLVAGASRRCCSGPLREVPLWRARVRACHYFRQSYLP